MTICYGGVHPSFWFHFSRSQKEVFFIGLVMDKRTEKRGSLEFTSYAKVKLHFFQQNSGSKRNGKVSPISTTNLVKSGETILWEIHVRKKFHQSRRSRVVKIAPTESDG